MNVRAELEYQEKTLESMEFHIWHNHNGCALERQNPRIMCPEDFVLLWSSALLAALTSLFI